MGGTGPTIQADDKGAGWGFCQPFTPRYALALPLCAQVSVGLSGGLSRPQTSSTEGLWKERTAQYWKAALRMETEKICSMAQPGYLHLEKYFLKYVRLIFKN